MAVKRVKAFVGAGREGYTYKATREFLDQLEALGGVETELVRLSDYRLEPCRGCKTCFAKGEEFCPLKDDRDLLLAKMNDSDGVVFASPNYSFQVSALIRRCAGWTGRRGREGRGPLASHSTGSRSDSCTSRGTRRQARERRAAIARWTASAITETACRRGAAPR